MSESFDSQLSDAHHKTTLLDEPDEGFDKRMRRVHDLLTQNEPPKQVGAYFLVVSPKEPAHWERIESSPFTIGRVDDADLTVEHAWVSARHCDLQADGDDWLLNDLGSTNGTFLNARKVKREFLRFGDLVHLGNTTLLFYLVRPPDQ